MTNRLSSFPSEKDHRIALPAKPDVFKNAVNRHVFTAHFESEFSPASKERQAATEEGISPEQNRPLWRKSSNV